MFRYKYHIDIDPWWKFIHAIHDLNNNHKNTISY